jgi:hypothetical protein
MIWSFSRSIPQSATAAGHVCFLGRCGKYMLATRFSQFDPEADMNALTVRFDERRGFSAGQAELRAGSDSAVCPSADKKEPLAGL